MWNICSGNKCDQSVCEVDSSGFHKRKWKWPSPRFVSRLETNENESHREHREHHQDGIVSCLLTSVNVFFSPPHHSWKLTCRPKTEPCLLWPGSFSLTRQWRSDRRLKSARVRARAPLCGVYRGSERVPVCERADCAEQLLSLSISVSLAERKNGTAGGYFCAEYSICTALYLMLWGWLSTVSRSPRQQLESPVISQHKRCSSDCEVFVFAK